MEQLTLQTMQSEPGIRNRAKFIEESRDVHFTFKPTFDLMSSEQALPPSYVLSLEFERNHENFSLLTHPDNSRSDYLTFISKFGVFSLARVLFQIYPIQEQAHTF